jgi:arginine decarboxylase
MPIIKELHERGLLPKDKYIICNGYKRPMYQEFIVELKNEGFENLIPILDSKNEINYYKEHLTGQTKIGMRIAS